MTPEEEQRRFRIPERDKLERQHAPKIESALRTQMDALVNNDMNELEIASAPNRVDEKSAELEAALLAFMLAMSAVSVDAAQDDLAAFALAVDPAEANEITQQLARARTAVALGLLNKTTRRALQNAIPAWLANPNRTVDDLLKELEPQMNRARAVNIARTEGTNVFAAGTGVVGAAVGVTQFEWYTMRDERVCPICRPMLGKRRELNGQYDRELPTQSPPPAHPRCRCGELMVIRSIKT
jgi:SPP1 gp7 family putative phage head morphogenesis protein